MPHLLAPKAIALVLFFNMPSCELCQDLLPDLDEETFFDRWMNINTGTHIVSLHFSLSKLCSSAQSGCVICSTILGGVYQFSTRMPWLDFQTFQERERVVLHLNFSPLITHDPSLWIDVYGLDEPDHWAMIKFSSPKGAFQH